MYLFEPINTRGLVYTFNGYYKTHCEKAIRVPRHLLPQNL